MTASRAEISEQPDQVELVVTDSASGQVQRFVLEPLTVALLAETATRAAANALRRVQSFAQKGAISAP